MLVESGLFGIIALSVDHLLQLWRVLLEIHSNLLLLLLKLFVLSEMLHKSSLVALEDLTLVGTFSLDLHEVFDCVNLVIHCNTVVHDLFFLLTDLFKLLKVFSNSLDDRV